MEYKQLFIDLYNIRRHVLAHPECYADDVTRFAAGGLGATVMNQHVTAAELVRCWQYAEYQVRCPACGGVVYLTRWSGRVNGGFFHLYGICPRCGTAFDEGMTGLVDISGRHVRFWRLAEILREVRETISADGQGDGKGLDDSQIIE